MIENHLNIKASYGNISIHAHEHYQTGNMYGCPVHNHSFLLGGGGEGEDGREFTFWL
jgi:hypothetical protein